MFDGGTNCGKQDQPGGAVFGPAGQLVSQTTCYLKAFPPVAGSLLVFY